MLTNRGFLDQKMIFLVGLACGLGAWVASAAYDSYMMGASVSFVTSLFQASEGTMMTRMAALMFCMAAGMVSQMLFNKISCGRQLQTLFDKSNDGLLLVDPETGDILDSNEKASELLGYSDDELKRLNVASIHPHDLPIAQRFLAEVMENGSGITDEVSCRTKTGLLVPAEVSASAIELGDKCHLLVSIRDISERQLAYHAMERALEEAQVANRAKSEFLANMSHELRTPLNAVIGFSELMVTSGDDPSARDTNKRYAEDIHTAGLHLLHLINDILDLSKVESGTDRLSEKEIDVANLVRTATILLGGSAVGSEKEISVEVPDDLPRLYADPRKLKQILINLMSNAVKFTDANGSVTLKCSCPPEVGHVFEVSDTGIGMNEEEVTRAFGLFQQIDSRLNRKYAGTGLGLPLTKSLVEQHGATINVESRPGMGTTVTVRFPESRIVAETADPAGMPQRVSA